MLMEIVLVGSSPICCIPLASFVVVVVPRESESINCGTYILNTTNLTWKKVNQALAIPIKKVVYLINFLGHKTLKSVSLFYVVTSFTSALPTIKCTFFPNKWVHFSSNSMVSLTGTRKQWNKWSSCKNSLSFLLGIEKCKMFSYVGTKVVKTRVVCHRKRYTCFFSGRSLK